MSGTKVTISSDAPAEHVPDTKPGEITLAELVVREEDIKTPTGRVITIRGLTLRQQYAIEKGLAATDKNAEKSGGTSDTSEDRMYYIILSMIVSIDGIAVPQAVGPAALMKLMDYLTGDEFNTLVLHYSEKSGLQKQVKNS